MAYEPTADVHSRLFETRFFASLLLQRVQGIQGIQKIRGILGVNMCAAFDTAAVTTFQSNRSCVWVIVSVRGYLLPVENVFYTGIYLQLALALPFRQPAKQTQAAVSSC